LISIRLATINWTFYAEHLRALLKELGLPSWIKTTGLKGFHIAVPLDAKADFATVARFAHRVGKLLVARDPENLTREFHKVDRRGRILVFGKTSTRNHVLHRKSF